MIYSGDGSLKDSAVSPIRKSVLDAKSAWRKYLAEGGGDEKTIPLSLGIATTFTAEAFIPFIGTGLLDIGIAPSIYIAPYNQLFQVCLNPKGSFGIEEDVNCILILWRSEDIMMPEITSFASGNKGAMVGSLGKVDELFSAIKSLRERFDGTLIVSTPPFPDTVVMNINDLDSASDAAYFHSRILARVYEHIHCIPNIHIFDLDTVQREYGSEEAHDIRKWYLYKQPYSEIFLHRMAGRLGRIFKALHTPLKKCVAVDCDNTLWGKVVGEEGVEGLELGDEFPGKAYKDFQQQLLHWHDKGVFLAILSKNNEQDVWDVFDSHDSMVLKKDHLAAWRINWNSKAENLLSIAEELNINPDSFVFIDDNPVEIEQMKAALPVVESILLPSDPAKMVSFLLKKHFFDRLSVTEEDRKRTQMVVQERRRSELRKTFSEEDFLSSLGLEIDLFLPGIEHLARVTQLINKTNQFNLTTIRRTEDEVRAIMESKRHKMYALKIRDRFGDYGLTGLSIVESVGDAWNIDTFLLSCRILGRKVETAFLSFIADKAREQGAKIIRAEFRSTPKNAPIAEMLPSHGFKKDGDRHWVNDVHLIQPSPGFIKVNSL